LGSFAMRQVAAGIRTGQS
jgi:hypothetical protein